MMNLDSKETVPLRRYDIDWLRTLAFMLLIFYHIGQFYVADWGWHVKSTNLSHFLKNIMLLVNQWRMPLIFLISGVALSLVESKVSALRLMKIRASRILLPLIFGIVLVVPPQVYYELIQSEGYNASYLDFMKLYFDTGTSMYREHQLISSRTGLSLGLITYNHLWYLLYLFTYTLVYLAIKPLLIRVNWQKITHNVSAISVLAIPYALVLSYDLMLLPYFPDDTFVLVGDWYNHVFYFTMLMFGYALAKLPNVWRTIIIHREAWFVCALLSYGLIIIRFNRAFGVDFEYNDAPFYIQLFINMIWSANKVFWLLTVIGFAGAYLNKAHPVLTYMNEAILPWYILHQTIIIVSAMQLSQYHLGPVIEPILLIFITFSGCAIGYEIIKRFVITRFVFGLKLQSVQ